MPLILKLYVAGNTHAMRRARENLTEIVGELESKPEVEVINIFENPAAARDMNIVAVPTLIRLDSDPPRKVIGDLSEWQVVRDALELEIASDCNIGD